MLDFNPVLLPAAAPGPEPWVFPSQMGTHQLAYATGCVAVWLETTCREQVAAEQYVATMPPEASEAGHAWLTKVQTRRRVLEALGKLYEELVPVPTPVALPALSRRDG
jgi:hypothetical protein